jgi:hypothetical protein
MSPDLFGEEMVGDVAFESRVESLEEKTEYWGEVSANRTVIMAVTEVCKTQ